MRIGYFSSGILGFESLIQLKIKPKIIFTENKSLDLQQYAKSNLTPIYAGKPNTEQAEQFLNKVKLDLIISVNYIFILKENIFNSPTLGSINLHGSLLLKYRGRTPHVWAIIKGEQFTGVTAHFIDEGCDTGDIIEQKKIEILHTDSGQDLLKKYKSVYPTTIQQIREVEKSRGFKDGYTTSEQAFSKARRSVVSKTNLKKGDILTKDNVTTKRPFLDNSIPAMDYNDSLGQRLKDDIEADTPLTKNLISYYEPNV